MDWLDLFIMLFLIASLVRGAEVGFARQFFSTFGFFFGLFVGAWVNALVEGVAKSPGTKALLALFLLLTPALMMMSAGEHVGMRIKFHLRDAKIKNKLDKLFGSVLAALTLLAAVWLGASIFRNIPDSGWQRQIRNSRIVTLLDNNLPSAPGLVTKLGHLIDPNNFPQVFTGIEPALQTDAPLPDMGELTPAVQKVRPSIVKIEGEGCNSEVEGSGFVAGDNQIVTNAHVVAGVRAPFVIDQKGKHGARVVLFDPNLDIAILRADNLAGKPLTIMPNIADNGTATAILGYPSGGGFSAEPGVILERFEAEGRNIYNQGHTVRDVYSVKTNIEHGNSGGPMIDKNGQVIGVIFARSINYEHVGYALAMQKVLDDINQATGMTDRVSTDSCTD
jgi:S1-C subfamily serine protease